MLWRVVDGPHPVKDTRGTDGVLFRFTIAKDGDKSSQRDVVVVISRSALASDEDGLMAEIREAIDTGGLTAVERYLDEADPPARLLVSSTSIAPSTG